MLKLSISLLIASSFFASLSFGQRNQSYDIDIDEPEEPSERDPRFKQDGNMANTDASDPGDKWGDGVFGAVGFGLTSLELGLNTVQKSYLGNRSFAGLGYEAVAVGYRVGDIGGMLSLGAGSQAAEGYHYTWGHWGAGVEYTLATWMFSTGQLSRATVGLVVSQQSFEISKASSKVDGTLAGRYTGSNIAVVSNLYVLVGPSWGFHAHMDLGTGSLSDSEVHATSTDLVKLDKIATTTLTLAFGMTWDLAR